MESKQRIKIKLDAHIINVEASMGSEQVIRDAEALLNRRFQHYRNTYPTASTEQLWMYTDLDIATRPQQIK